MLTLDTLFEIVPMSTGASGRKYTRLMPKILLGGAVGVPTPKLHVYHGATDSDPKWVAWKEDNLYGRKPKAVTKKHSKCFMCALGESHSQELCALLVSILPMHETRVVSTVVGVSSAWIHTNLHFTRIHYGANAGYRLCGEDMTDVMTRCDIKLGANNEIIKRPHCWLSGSLHTTLLHHVMMGLKP